MRLKYEETSTGLRITVTSGTFEIGVSNQGEFYIASQKRILVQPEAHNRVSISERG